MRISWRRIVFDPQTGTCTASFAWVRGRWAPGAARYAYDQTGGNGAGFAERGVIGAAVRALRREAARRRRARQSSCGRRCSRRSGASIQNAADGSSHGQFRLVGCGRLDELQTELVTVIDEQARTLDHLASRLLSAGMLDITEFKPKCEPLLLSDLIRAAIERLDQETDRERFTVSMPDPEAPILADRELILTSIAQLVDNAIKYSEPGSPIRDRLHVQ